MSVQAAGSIRVEMEVDARLLGRPPRFTGVETEWSDWSFQARAHFDTVSQSMADHIDAVKAVGDREDPSERTQRSCRRRRAKDVEAWRLLIERYSRDSASRLHRMLQSITSPMAFPQGAGGFEAA